MILEEFEFKNSLLLGTTLFISLTCGLSALRAGVESGNFALGALGTTVCIAGLGISYKIYRNTIDREM